MRRLETSEYEFESQFDIMVRISARNSLLPTPPKAFVDTYGCQQNAPDSERLRGFLSCKRSDDNKSEL